MTTLRESQKQRRKTAIFQAAVELFTQKGYANSSMEEIARMAAVSVPTIYAYYSSKADLMLALYASDREMVSADKQSLIANPPAEPAEAITQMILIELSKGIDYLDNSVWRELVASGIKAGNLDYHAGLERLNELVFDTPMRDLLLALRGHGLIRDDIDIDSVIDLFSDLTMAVFHQQISRDFPWSWVEERVQKTVQAAVFGLRP